MKKYMITERYNIEGSDIDGISFQEVNDDMYFVEATSKNEAILKYLSTKCEFEPRKALRDMLFLDFWTSVCWGEYEYIDEFINSQSIRKMADEIYDTFFLDDASEPEEILLQSDTEELRTKYWNLLTEQDRKVAYYHCNYCDVFCVELTSIAKMKKRNRINQKNIIEDVEKEDIFIWNLLTSLIRKAKKESYCLTTNIISEVGGVESEAAKKIIAHLCSARLKNVVELAYDNGGFTLYSLVSMITIHTDEDVNNVCVEIFPTDILYRFAKHNYNFADGKNELAIKIMMGREEEIE